MNFLLLTSYIKTFILHCQQNWCCDTFHSSCRLCLLVVNMNEGVFKWNVINKSEKVFGYSKRYPKCDIQSIVLRNPKHLVFLTYKYIAQQVKISEKILSEIWNNFSIMSFGYPKAFLDMLWCLALLQVMRLRQGVSSHQLYELRWTIRCDQWRIMIFGHFGQFWYIGFKYCSLYTHSKSQSWKLIT